MPHFVHTMRAELAHHEASWILIDLEDHLVPAAVAHDVKRPHAVPAHVREVHGLDFVLEHPPGFPRPDNRGFVRNFSLRQSRDRP
jgi:hypothetical protein